MWAMTCAGATAAVCVPVAIPRISRVPRADGPLPASAPPHAKPPAFGQMARGHHQEIPVIERVLPHVRGTARPARSRRRQRAGAGGTRRTSTARHAPVVMQRHPDDAQFVRADRRAEAGGQTDTASALRIGQEVTDLGHRKGRHDETGPVVGQKPRAPARGRRRPC